MEMNGNDYVHTGPGTLCGRYLRMFWQPVLRARDLKPGYAMPVEIMSEKLTVYRGEEGTPHVVAGRCAHRGTQLSTGWVEGDCIRCLYHGWKYDSTGQCIEQPGLEEHGFAHRIRIAAYPTQEYLGLIFAYLGEGEPPPLRRFPDHEKPGVLDVGPPEYWPCNYFNRLDNAADGAHMSWTHRESTSRVGRVIPTCTTRGSEETDYGLRAMSARPGQPTHYVHLHFPNINQNLTATRVEGSFEDAKSLLVNRLFFRVPVDDENSVSFVVDHVALTGEAGRAYAERRRHAEESQDASLKEIAESILAGKMRIRDIDRDMSLYKLFWIEDYVSQCGQGAIADRAAEHASHLDYGTLMIRKVYERELGKLAAGAPLKQWAEVENLVHDEVKA
jgi:5,5'-dehydrodivanillate O-demethylase